MQVSLEATMTINNLFLLGLLINATILAVVVDSKAIDLTWQRWKQKHAKQYVDSGEEQKRRGIWQQQVDEITEHNIRFEMGLESYKQGLNKFSDLTWEEFQENYLMTGLIDQDLGQERRPEVDMSRLPSSVDWRKKGYVTSVKDQGNCGSCWSFSVAGTLEGQMANKTRRRPIDLSTQQQVDCSKKTSACAGGWPYIALKYTRKYGLESDSAYPYVGRKQSCRYNQNSVSFKNGGMLYVRNAGEKRLAEMVAYHGPVSVTIRVTSDFYRYSSGVYVTDRCTSIVPSHAIVATGYGSERGLDYWECKNSWGADWGDRGYIKMARNRNDMCNIAYWPVVAVI